MSLLQDPYKALDQIEWYLDNQSLEKFPNAFLKSAGNLSRQILEQILFILAFYSRMPHNKYIKQNLELRSVNTIINSLQDTNPSNGKKYLEEARQQGSRICKFARYPRSFNKWRREFNEFSHFRNPATTRSTEEKHIREFVTRMREIIDPLDTYLIIAAVNEILSKGKIKAILGKEPECIPSVEIDLVITPKDIKVKNGEFFLESKEMKFYVVPADHEVSLLKWRNKLILVQHSKKIGIIYRFITEDGQPINPSNVKTLIASFGKNQSDRDKIKKHLKKFGIVVEWDIQ